MYYVSGYNVVWHRVNSPEEWYDALGAGTAIHVDYDKFIHYDLPDEEGVLKLTSISTDTRLIYDTPAEMYGKSYVYTTEEEGYKEIVLKELKAEGWIKPGMTIGLEFGSYRPNYLVFAQWKEMFEAEGCKVVNATEVIREARSVKSKLELQYIETATRICDIGMKAIYDALEPGITELEIVGAYTQAQCKAGGEIQGIPYMVRSGPYRSWSFHIPASRRKIMLGDPVGVDLAGVYNRYHSNQCRYFSVDEPPKEFAELYSVNKKIMDMVKEKIRPDMLVAELLCDLRDFYKEEGLWGKQYWIGGYEMGIAFPPDWCGGFLTYDIYMDCDNTEKRFVPGTVVNFETGFGVIDTLMFKEDEAIVLGNTPRELMIKEF
jgi:Xaa-Pro aminopeptidase